MTADLAATPEKSGTSEPNGSRKRPLWASLRLYLVTLLILLPVSLILWVAIAGHPGRQFKLSPQTTVITDPLTAEGFVDYAEVLRRRIRDSVNPEENAARLVVEAFGPSMFGSPEEAMQAYEQLDMSPLPATGDYFVQLRKVVDDSAAAQGLPSAYELRFLVQEEQLPYCMQIPWSSVDAPELDAWVTVNAGPLEKIHEASRLPHFRPPIIEGREFTRLTLLLPITQETREFERLLALRAMQRLHASDADAAWEDMHAMLRVARIRSQGDALIDFQVAVHHFGEASNATSALLSSPELTPELLQQMQSDWEALPDWHDITEFHGTLERFTTLSDIQRASRYGPQAVRSAYHAALVTDPPVEIRFINALVDWDQLLVTANDFHDEAQIAIATPDVSTRERLVERYERRIDDLELHSGGMLSTRSITNLLLPSLLFRLRSIHRALCRRDAREVVMTTTFAIEQFRFDHDRIPASLAELVPEYLSSIPSDPCDPGNILLYANQGGDAYVLYSVGENRIDDGGLTKNDDVAIRIRMPIPDWLQIEPPAVTDPTTDASLTDLPQ